MSLRDFNFYDGDLTIENDRIDTDDKYSVELTIDNRLRTLIYKTLIYKDVLKNRFLGTRINDLFDLENEIINFCKNTLLTYYGTEELVFIVNIECVILDQGANIYFYYVNDEGKLNLLFFQEITL
jgi:hypothetical protein